MTLQARGLAAFDFDNTITESTSEPRYCGDEIVFNMGSASRVFALRKLFVDLRKSGVILIVVSLNFRETIENVLAQYGLLKFFSRIYDRTNIWAQDIATKQILMETIITRNHFSPTLCVLVDDHRDNLVDAPCNVVEIRGPGGITMKHDNKIRRIFNIPITN